MLIDMAAATCSFDGDKAVARTIAESIVSGEDKPSPSHNEATAAEAAAEDDAAVVPEKEITAVLSEDYVDWILSRKRAALDEDPDEYYNRMISDPGRPEVYTPEFLEEERQTMRDMAAVYQRVGDRFEKFQQWVRLQLEEKGFVEVGESYIARRVEHREHAGEEQWKALMGSLA